MTSLIRALSLGLLLLSVSPAWAQPGLTSIAPFGQPSGTPAAVGDPSLDVSLNQTTYGLNQRLTLGVKVQTPGGGPVCDFFIGIILPDGATAVSVRLGAPPVFGAVANLRSLVPIAAGVSLANSFAVDQTLFEYTFVGGEPLGDYLVYFASVRTGALTDGVIGPGELLALETQTFRFTTTPAVATVEIQQTGLLLTEIGATRQLSATAKDEYGNPLNVTIAWSSTRPEQIAVDAIGLVRAETNNGSSQIIADASGVVSAPLLVVVTPVAPDAILITDAQIVGAPVETDPTAPPSLDNTYRVTLSGVSPPPIGSLLVNTESQPVAGRVVAVDVTGNQVIATLAIVPLPELLPNLVVDEVVDITNAPVTVAPDIAAAYDVQRSGNTFTFTPKPAAEPNLAHVIPVAVGTRALPPFTSCETTISGFPAGAALPLQLNAPPLFSLTVNPSLDVKYTPERGLERFVVRAEPTAKVESGITLTAAFEGKITCTVELFVFRIPVGGLLSLVFGGLVPIGAGLEAGGKFTVATLGLGAKVEASIKAAIGVACAGGGCGGVQEFGDFTLKATAAADAPSIGDVRLEPSLAMFGFVKLAVGNPFLKSLRFEAFQAKIGGKLQGSFALPASQLADTTYRSDYKFSLEASAGVGNELESALARFGLSTVIIPERALSLELAKSPAPAAASPVTADRATFTVGDRVSFRVKLDPATVNFFPGRYNVARILLVRGRGDAQVVGSAMASAGQTEFTIPFTATAPGAAEDFSAFVVTALAPFDLFALEIGIASGTNPPPPSGTIASLRITTSLTDPTNIVGDINAPGEDNDVTIVRPISDPGFAGAVQAALAGFSELSSASFELDVPVSLSFALGRSVRGSLDVSVGCSGGPPSSGATVAIAAGAVGEDTFVNACGARVNVSGGDLGEFVGISASQGGFASLVGAVTGEMSASGCNNGTVDVRLAVREDVDVVGNVNCRVTVIAPTTGGVDDSEMDVDENRDSIVQVVRTGELEDLRVSDNERGTVTILTGDITDELSILSNVDLPLGSLDVGDVGGVLTITNNIGFSDDQANAFADARSAAGGRVISGNRP
jgi:hypothetical protein